MGSGGSGHRNRDSYIDRTSGGLASQITRSNEFSAEQKADLSKRLGKATNSARSTGQIDPLNSFYNEFQQLLGDRTRENKEKRSAIRASFEARASAVNNRIQDAPQKLTSFFGSQTAQNLLGLNNNPQAPGSQE